MNKKGKSPTSPTGLSGVLARRLAAGQTLYRLMGYRLGPLLVVWSTNPGSEGLTDHSPGGLMLHYPGHVPSQRGPSGDKGSGF